MTEVLQEIRAGERFGFGRNWKRFLGSLTPERVRRASASLLKNLERDNLTDVSFLDIGSGSGLSSLAAFHAGARVTSFDYDPQSVECTQSLQRDAGASERWTVLQGSVLDPQFMSSLGHYDVVYSWGVLHHTGRMWEAVNAAIERVSPGGTLFIALYNDQGWISRYWLRVKRLYNAHPLGAVAMFAIHAPYFIAARAVGQVQRRLQGQPRDDRGMHFWRDVDDWLGGYPFEVATPAEVTRRLAQLGFETRLVKSVGRRNGCNEFVFRRTNPFVRH